jgi:hypothetical protein
MSRHRPTLGERTSSGGMNSVAVPNTQYQGPSGTGGMNSGVVPNITRRPTISDRGPSGTGGMNRGVASNTRRQDSSDTAFLSIGGSTLVNFTGGAFSAEPTNIDRTQTQTAGAAFTIFAPPNIEHNIEFAGFTGRMSLDGAPGPPLPPRLPIPANSANVTGISAFTERIPQFTESRPESRYTV